jgi:hypothetical protein
MFELIHAGLAASDIQKRKGKNSTLPHTLETKQLGHTLAWSIEGVHHCRPKVTLERLSIARAAMLLTAAAQAASTIKMQPFRFQVQVIALHLLHKWLLELHCEPTVTVTRLWTFVKRSASASDHCVHTRVLV